MSLHDHYLQGKKLCKQVLVSANEWWQPIAQASFVITRCERVGNNVGVSKLPLAIPKFVFLPHPYTLPLSVKKTV
jgi:hypothetical protein